MEIPQSKALELIGAQQIEITILRERIGILSQHRCEPCDQECCAKPAVGAMAGEADGSAG